MNNIYIEKVWNDLDLIEIFIEASSEFVMAKQKCYITTNDLYNKGEKIIEYTLEDKLDDLYLEFGQKKGNFTPSFSMKIIKKDSWGHYYIEMDMEIDDIPNRSHRCVFFVEVELGGLKDLGEALIKISKSKENIKFSLYN